MTDTDEIDVRVERGRQGRGRCRVVEATIPGFLLKNRFHRRGGWNNYEGGFISCYFEIPTFPQGGLKDRQEVNLGKITAGKIAAW
jgi:hypothetical protein